MISAIENTERIFYDLLLCTLYGIATTDIDFNQDTFPFLIYTRNPQIYEQQWKTQITKIFFIKIFWSYFYVDALFSPFDTYIGLIV